MGVMSYLYIPSLGGGGEIKHRTPLGGRLAIFGVSASGVFLTPKASTYVGAW
jgi:hypothetical protein